MKDRFILFFVIGIFAGFLLGCLTSVYLMDNSRFVDDKTCFIDSIIIPGDKIKIVDQINSAKESIYIEMYLLTDPDIILAIKNAYDNGVDVKIILEEDMSYNKKTFMELVSTGIPVKWDGDRYKITHSKLMIIDNQTVVLGSPNYTYFGLTKNRELGLITNCSVKPYLEIFMDDWND